MSDAMSSVEIEDVLSSIRRLVSEDLRPAPRPQIVSRMVVEDKLILTPALRVVRSGVQASAPVAPTAPPPRLHLGPAQMVLPVAPEVMTPDVVTALAQAVGQQALDWESETGDPGPEADSLDWSSFTFARRTLAETWTALAPLVERAEAELPVQIADPLPWAQPDAAGAAALHVAEESVNPAGTALADETEAEVLARLHQPEPPAAEVMPGGGQTDDNIFSEQILRELVRDLIRAELQGDLGEKITRNIRKLVRAEIARAVAVQALD